jgi:outer membrane receptor protein involved in Fe transport
MLGNGTLNTRRLGTIALLLVSVSLCYSPVSALEKTEINLPAQTLDRDIRDLARQTGITISYSRRTLKNYAKASLSGRYTAQESLDILLRDTDYTYKFVNENTVRIFKKQRPKKIRATPKSPTITKQNPRPTVFPQRPPAPDFIADEIIVTSNKRTKFEMLQSAPYSASVISGNMLQALGVIDTQSLSLHIAGVEMTNLGSSRNKMSVRGISDGAFNGRVQATVGVYFNDTPINFNAPYPEIPLIDIDSVEVLRGPQGSLYGAGSIGGIYHITTNTPDLRQKSAWLETGISTTREGGTNTELLAMANIPIVKDKVGVRAVGYVLDNSGYIDDVRLGIKDINQTKIKGGRLNGMWQVSPDWSLSAGANYHDVRTDDTQYALGTLPRLQRENYLQEPHADDLLHLHANIVGDKQWGKVKSTTSWINRNISDQFDASLSLPDNFARNVEPTRYTEKRKINFFSHETTVNVDVNDTFDVLLGGFFSFADNDFNSEYKVIGGANGVGSEILYEETRNDTTTHFGAFGEVDIVLSDKLELSAGVRWFDEHLKTETLINDFGQAPEDIRGEKTDSDILPRLNIGYQFTEDSYLYGLVTLGYRVGGLNTGNAVNSFAAPTGDVETGESENENEGEENDNLSVFESDVITMYEFGGKTRWLDDTLIINASIFYVDWQSIQTEHILDDGFSSVLNAGDATNLGYDFEVLYHPVQNIDIQANLTVNDPDLTNINPALGTNIDSKHLPRIPDVSAGVIFTYRAQINPSWRSSWSIDYAFTGTSQLSFAPSDDLSMGNNHYVNARVNFANDVWQLEGFINNVLDDKSNTFAFGNPFTFRKQQHVTPQRPRTIGVRAKRHF